MDRRLWNNKGKTRKKNLFMKMVTLHPSTNAVKRIEMVLVLLCLDPSFILSLALNSLNIDRVSSCWSYKRKQITRKQSCRIFWRTQGELRPEISSKDIWTRDCPVSSAFKSWTIGFNNETQSAQLDTTEKKEYNEWHQMTNRIFLEFAISIMVYTWVARWQSSYLSSSMFCLVYIC